MRWRAQIDPHLFCSCHFAFVWTHGPPSSPSSSSSSSLLSPPPLPLLSPLYLALSPARLGDTHRANEIATRHYGSLYLAGMSGLLVAAKQKQEECRETYPKCVKKNKKYRLCLYSPRLVFVVARPALKRRGTLCNLEVQACNAWRKH